MKKTFDDLCAEILGENVPPANNNQQQNQQQGQTTQPSTTYKATPPINKPNPQQPQQAEVPEEIAKLFIAAKTPQEVNAAYLKLQQMNQQSQNASANKPA